MWANHEHHQLMLELKRVCELPTVHKVLHYSVSAGVFAKLKTDAFEKFDLFCQIEIELFFLPTAND